LVNSVVVQASRLPGTNQGGGQITALTLTGSEATAQQRSGITVLHGMVAAWPRAGIGFDPTFNNYADYASATHGATTYAVNIAAGTVVGGLDPTPAPRRRPISDVYN